MESTCRILDDPSKANAWRVKNKHVAKYWGVKLRKSDMESKSLLQHGF